MIKLLKNFENLTAMHICRALIVFFSINRNYAFFWCRYDSLYSKINKLTGQRRSSHWVRQYLKKMDIRIHDVMGDTKNGVARWIGWVWILRSFKAESQSDGVITDEKSKTPLNMIWYHWSQHTFLKPSKAVCQSDYCHYSGWSWSQGRIPDSEIKVPVWAPSYAFVFS